MVPPLFLRAVNNARPHGAHRYDLFGPKIGRRLTLLGRVALDHRVRLESDPHVVTYCERSLCIPDAKPLRVVAFSVRTHHDEKLCVLPRRADRTSVEQGHSLFPAFQSWSRASSMQLQMIHPQDLDDPHLLRENRIMMLRYVMSGHALPVDGLMPGVLIACSNGITLAELERQFAAADPTLVRSVAFRLVLDGRVRCPTFPNACAGTARAAYPSGAPMKMIVFGTLRFDPRSIPPDLTDIGQWPGADDSALSDEGHDLLTRRIRAMTLFVDGHTPLREITRETGVGFSDLYRVFERCISQHDDGRIFGCRALIPYQRTRS